MKPTTQGDVSIVLLRGPADKAEEFKCIKDSIPNTGSFSWTPEGLDVDNSRYGLKIIVDATGDYQYSPQFGISQGKESPEGTSSKSPQSTKPPKTCTETTKPCHPTAKPDHTSKSKEMSKSKEKEHPSSKPYKFFNSTTAYPTSHKPKSLGTSYKSKPTHVPSSKSKKPPVTSTALVTSSVTTQDQNPSTAVNVVTPSAGEGAPPTVTAAQPSTPTQPPNGAAGLKVTGVLLSGVAAVALFVL